jgi:hypothetical protein
MQAIERDPETVFQARGRAEILEDHQGSVHKHGFGGAGGADDGPV